MHTLGDRIVVLSYRPSLTKQGQAFIAAWTLLQVEVSDFPERLAGKDNDSLVCCSYSSSHAASLKIGCGASSHEHEFAG